MKRIFAVLALLWATAPCYGFNPIAHMLLADKVRKELPPQNVFKRSMDAYPEIARIGAIGPDLPASSVYFYGMSLFHYHRVGSFAKALLTDAMAPLQHKSFEQLDSNEVAYLAFAGGWITHIGGDFGSHQLFIYPIAGFYLAGNHNERTAHSDNETYADGYLLRAHTPAECNSILQQYDAKQLKAGKKMYKKVLDALVTDKDMGKMVAIQTKTHRLIEEILDDPRPGYLEMKKNADNFRNLSPRVMKVDPAALDTSHHHVCATDIKDKKNQLIDSAFAYGVNFATGILADAHENKFHRISDNWNLDVGPDGSPTYTVSLAFDDKGFSGTRNDLFILLTNKKNQTDTFQLIEETVVYKAMNDIKSENRAYRQFKWSGMRYMYYIYPEGAAGRGCADREYATNCPDPALFRYSKNDLKGFKVYVKKRKLGDSKLTISNLDLYVNGEKIFALPPKAAIYLNASNQQEKVSQFYPIAPAGVAATQ